MSSSCHVKGSHNYLLVTLLLTAILLSASTAFARDRSQELNKTTLLVGSELDYPPYATVDENGEADGFSVDLIKAVAREMGLTLKFQTGPWSQVKGKLERGEIDILPLVAYSKERDRHFDFSHPHIISHAVIFIRKNEQRFQSAEDFRDREAIVMRGDSTHEYVTSSHLTDKITLTQSIGDALKLLSSGKHDFVIAPKLPGLLLLKRFDIDNIEPFGGPLETYGKGYSFTVRNGDSELLEHLNRGLLLIRKSGEYDRIYDKWFGQLEPKRQTDEELVQIMVAGASILLLFIFITLLWNRMLRHQVAIRTAELKASEERFRDVSEAAGEYVWEIDPDMIYTYASGQSKAVKGYSPEELLGHTPMEFMPEEDIGKVGKIVNEAIAYKKAFKLQHRNITPSGEVYWEEVSGTPFYDEAGDVIGLRGTGLSITSRIEAEEILRDSEARFRAMAETLPLAIYVSSGEEQVCDYINPRFVELLGYTTDDVPDVAHWWPLAYPDESYRNHLSEEWNARVKRAIETHSDIEPMEATVRCKDGSTKDIVWGFQTLTDRNYAFGLDVTDRNKAAAQLIRDEQRFRALFESTADYALVLEIKDDGPPIIIDGNKAAFIKHGYSRDEMIGQPITLLDKHMSKEKLEEVMQKILRGRALHFEVEHTCKDGTSFLAEVTTQLVIGEERNIFFTIERDISEKKQAQAKIEKLSQAVIQSGEGVVIADVKGTIEYVNPAFTTITGYSEEEALGQNPSILKSGNQSSVFYEDMWETLKAGEPWQGKVVNKKKDGTFYPAMLTISPIKNEGGEITHYIGLQQNLEEYEALEAQFRQAQKMEAIGTLVGGIAHDFNNILAGMTGNLYLARKRTTDPDVAEKLAIVEQLSYRSAELIKQLLTFARKDLIDMRPLPLTPFVKEILKLLRASIPEDIAIHHNICPDTLIVNGDGTQLHQVLLNLVNNAHDAVEAVQAPCICINLETIYADEAFIRRHPDFAAGAYAHLSVEDNGTGIPGDQIPHLFEPFFTTKEQGKGTGLGLAMVFGAVQSHSGHIEVESIEGEGSTFHIYLPLIDTEDVETANKQSKDLARGNGELILIVDDESQLIQASKEVLESLNYRVIEACNGLEAIDQLKANESDLSLVITDVVMPELSGVEAVKEMMRIRPDLKVIFLTGYDRGAISASRMPSDEYIILRKPFDISELSHAIRSQLDSSQ